MLWPEGGRKGSWTARRLSPPLLSLLGADSGEDSPISPILRKPMLAGADQHFEISLPPCKAQPVLLEGCHHKHCSKMLTSIFPGGDRQVGKSVEPRCTPQCAPAGSPGQAMEEQDCRWLQLNRNGLKAETPSCLPVLTSVLVWNRKAFAIGCCLPKMDQNLDKSYLADLALGAFLKLLWTHSLIISSCEQDGEDSIKWISLLFTVFFSYWL